MTSVVSASWRNPGVRWYHIFWRGSAHSRDEHNQKCSQTHPVKNKNWLPKFFRVNMTCFCSSLLLFIKIIFFKYFFQGHYLNVKRFGSRSGPTFLVLISGQTVCIGYQQMTNVAAGMERVNPWSAKKKMHLTFLTNLSIEANRVNPDQTAPQIAVWSGSTLFDIEAS